MNETGTGDRLHAPLQGPETILLLLRHDDLEQRRQALGCGERQIDVKFVGVLLLALSDSVALQQYLNV